MHYVIIGKGTSRRRSGPGENNENMNPGRVFERMQFTLQFCCQYNVCNCVRMLCISGWESLPNNLGWLATIGLQSRDVSQLLRSSCVQLTWQSGEAMPAYVILQLIAILTNQRLAPSIKARGSVDFDSSVTGFVKRVTYVIYSYVVFVCNCELN